MKKFSKVMSTVAILAMAITTFGCGVKEENYEAENNIVNVCPEVAKEIKKPVESKEDATALISNVIAEYATAFLGGLLPSERMTAKDAKSAAKQISKFYTAFTDVMDAAYDDQGNFVNPIKVKAKLDVADLNAEDVIEIVMDLYNENLEKEVNENDKITDKAKYLEEAKLSIDDFKEILEKYFGDAASKAYELIVASFGVDRVLLDVNIDIEDKDGDKNEDYMSEDVTANIAFSVKDINALVNLFFDPKQKKEDVVYPVRAIALSTSDELKSTVTDMKEIEKMKITVDKYALDVGASLAVVTKEGFGGYMTVEASMNITQKDIDEIVEAALEADFTTILNKLGKVKISFSNGKKETYAEEWTVDDIMKLIPIPSFAF